MKQALFGMALSVGLTWLLASGESAQAGDEPCIAKKFEFAEVRAACNEGGLKAAKDLMKAAVKRAKADGNDYKCNTCHENQKTFELKADAAAKLKPYLKD